MAVYFVEPPKAEENLQALHQMKYESVFPALSTLFNPSTTVAQAATVRVCLIALGECDRSIITPFFSFLSFHTLVYCLSVLFFTHEVSGSVSTYIVYFLTSINLSVYVSL